MLSWSNLETSASGRKGGRANALERKEGALIRADGNRDGTAAACADYDIMREVFLPCLADMQMEETCAADVGAPEREGRMFRMPRDVASGYFWLYAERDFAISATDMLFPRDFREQCRHPRFVSVRYYLSGSCVESVTNRTVEAPYLEGHVLDTPHWDCLCRAGTPIRNVEIMLAPPFYEQYLREVYRDEAFSAEEAFASIDGLSDFPEMVVLLKQVEAYRGRGASARLFYRSKVEEAVALVVDKSRAMAGERASELASEDMHAIERVRRRLEQQLAAPVDADELARIACMGRPSCGAPSSRRAAAPSWSTASACAARRPPSCWPPATRPWRRLPQPSATAPSAWPSCSPAPTTPPPAPTAPPCARRSGEAREDVTPGTATIRGTRRTRARAMRRSRTRS